MFSQSVRASMVLVVTALFIFIVFRKETTPRWHARPHCKKHATTTSPTTRMIKATDAAKVPVKPVNSTATLLEAKPRPSSFIPKMPIPASCFRYDTKTDQRLVDNWRKSFALLLQHAPPDVLRSTPTKHDIDAMLSLDVIRRWLSTDYSAFSSGYTYIYPLSSSYLRIYKAANNAVRDNLHERYGRRASSDYFAGSTSKVKQSKCIFTFVRDPVQHFLSGYNEYEYRAILKGFECRHCLYNTFPKGSEERFWAFISDLLSFKFLHCFPEGGCHVVNGQLKHVFPMSSILRNYDRVDFVGSIDNMAEDWQRLGTDCLKVENEECELSALDDSLGQHESSADPHGIYGAAKNVVKQSQHVQEILKGILVEDYRCFGGEEY